MTGDQRPANAPIKETTSKNLMGEIKKEAKNVSSYILCCLR
jgi:hypothetical protein